MALIGRSPIKVTAAPSTAPQEAMAASLQAHIGELVQKNRTCEHTIKRLQQSLADEKERAIEAISRIKVEMQQEREEWREGCDSLLASHRIVHIRTRIELDKERANVQLEREESRRERINILHRDFRLTLFQAKESELEAKIGTLEDALEELTEERDQDEKEYTEKIGTLVKDLMKADRARADLDSRLKSRNTEFSTLQSEVSTLRKENATLKTSSESSSAKLERTELQLEGAKTSLTELESANAELKRTNVDLKRQVDRWQDLETKGGAEVEEMRKRKIELEVQVKELQSRVKGLEKAEKENAKALEKERKKVEKLKKENDRMAEVTEEAQSIAKKAQDEYDEAAEQLRNAQKLVEKLQGGKIPKDRKGKKTFHGIEIPAETESHDPSEREVEKVLTPKPNSRVRSRPAEEDAQDSPEAIDEAFVDDKDDEAPPTKRSSKPRARTKGGNSNTARKLKDKASNESEIDDALEDIAGEASRTTKFKGKGKEKAIEPPSDSEDEPRAKKKGKAAKRHKGDQSHIETTAPKAKQKSRNDDEDEDGTDAQLSSQPKGRKPSSSQASRIKATDNTNEADAQPKKKKKRLFPPSQAESFSWDVLPKGEGFGGLQIPTQLSPVKETGAVPGRSVFGKVGSALGFR